jgi:hypothetical protein
MAYCQVEKLVLFSFSGMGLRELELEEYPEGC